MFCNIIIPMRKFFFVTYNIFHGGNFKLHYCKGVSEGLVHIIVCYMWSLNYIIKNVIYSF